jgi:hypothetical protein
MKKIKLSLVTMLLLSAVACKKTGNSPSSRISGNVSTDEAADMVGASLSVNSNGIANISDDAALAANAVVTAHTPCGTTRTDSISRQSHSGSAVSFNYKLKYAFTVNCSNNQPDSLSASLTYSGSFSGPRLSSTNSGSSIFTVNGLLPTAKDFVINGEFKRSGSFQSKADTSNHGNNNIDIILKGLTIRKVQRTIAAGSATFSISGDVPHKGSFSFNGTLVFNGDGTATLTINGAVYTINLFTGEHRRD